MPNHLEQLSFRKYILSAHIVVVVFVCVVVDVALFESNLAKTCLLARGPCMVARLRDQVWTRHWVVCVCHWHPNYDTHTTRLNQRAAATMPPVPTAPSPLALGPSLTRGTPARESTTRSQSWAAATCSALSCVFSASSGECRTYRSLSLCSCRAYRWCVRGSVSFGRCCWQSVCRIHQTHT